MTDLRKFQSAPGYTISDSVAIIYSETDPTVSGNSAPAGSVLLYTDTINGLGYLYIKQGTSDTEWVKVGTTGPQSDNVQPTFIMRFFKTSNNTKNVWLSYMSSSSTPSSEVPALTPWRMRFLGITYANNNPVSDIDLEIYKVSETDTTTPLTLMFKYEIRNARVARKTDLKPSNIIFEAGDKVAIYLNGVTNGSSPKNPNFDLHFEVIEDSRVDNSFSYSGDFVHP